MIGLFCHHQWVEVQRRDVPGEMEKGGRIKVDDLLNHETQMIVFGYTLIEQRCEKCGKVTLDQFIGPMKRNAA